MAGGFALFSDPQVPEFLSRWRTRQNARLDIDQRLPDGSYLSRIYASASDRRRQRKGIVVRVIDYRLKDVKDAEPIYRLITTILDPTQAPAKELAALYHERWEIGVSSQGHIVQSSRCKTDRGQKTQAS